MKEAGEKEGKEEGGKVPQIKKIIKEGGKMKNCLTRTVLGGIPFLLIAGRVSSGGVNIT